MATAPGTAPTKRSGLLWKLATVPGEQSIKRPLSALRTAGTAARLPGGLASANPAVSKLLRGIGESIKAALQQRGAEEAVSQVIQRGQESVGQATQPVQEVAGQATEQTQGLAE